MPLPVIRCLHNTHAVMFPINHLER